MKFLDLNTGYSFDGLWKNISSYTDWIIYYRDIPKVCNVCDAVFVDDSALLTMMNDSNNEILYSSEPNAINPGESNDWHSQFDFNNTCKFAVRKQVPQTKGYVFWFPNEQSTNITYSMPICILTNEFKELTLNIEENDIFSFVSHIDEECVVDGYVFNTPIYSKTIITTPEKIGNYYAHLVNISCSSKINGEFICRINVGDEGYIRVGADFYGEWEPTYINLSNMGVEIPDTVQKAIYDSNVHEDFKDNIIINRKFKELLSNYWDVIANRGSYKSLNNSLKWFEWDNSLNIKEIWKRDEAGLIMFDDREIMSIFENKLADSFENFIKTTYVSLYYSAYSETANYDSEYNPELEEIVMKWSKNDMRLKMALLAQFFGTFFLPIHLSILHATVEDKVFTNTIKTIYGTDLKRDDAFGDFNFVESNVKDDQIFKIANVRAQVTNNTVFGIKYNALDGENYNKPYFGVDVFPSKGRIEDLKTFAQQYYVGPGVIIPIELEISNQKFGDFIKHTIIDYTDDYNHMSRLDFYNRFYVRDNKIVIKFNFLAKHVMNYNIRFTFITGSSKTITKSLTFTVEDADNIVLNMYKVQAKDDSKGFTMQDFLDTTGYDYLYRITNNTTTYYTQYLPYMDPSNKLYETYNGIKLNRTVIFDIQNKNGKSHKYNRFEILVIRGLMDDEFLEFPRYDENGDLTYLVYVSKYFYAKTPQELIDRKYNIIRDELGFYPQFHNLKLMTGNNIDNYTVSQYEAVCCAAEINNGKTNERFRYGHLIDKAEWEFYNPVSMKNIEFGLSSRNPFVADNYSLLNDGYYDITFNYSLANGVTNTCKRESAFRIKVI